MRRMKVVDSPPGMTRPSRSSSCSGLRTSTTSAPSRRSIAACSRKFPCTARTPIRGPSIGRNGREGRSMSVAAVLLALASSATWGIADFAGGLVSRRLPTLAVTVVSQVAGFTALLAVVGARGRSLDGGPLVLGLLAGVGGGVGVAAFYKALSLGTMSVVSPLVACSALVPFAVSLATGERPSGLALVAACVALAGAVLASAEERRAPTAQQAVAIAYAAFAAVALGFFTYFLG